MIAEHQRVKIHLHKIARRAEHILVINIFSTGVESNSAALSSNAQNAIFLPPLHPSYPVHCITGRGRIGKANKRSESTALPPPRALDSLSRRVYNKIGVFLRLKKGALHEKKSTIQYILALIACFVVGCGIALGLNAYDRHSERITPISGGGRPSIFRLTASP